jgi:hypothetical protein
MATSLLMAKFSVMASSLLMAKFIPPKNVEFRCED